MSSSSWYHWNLQPNDIDHSLQGIVFVHSCISSRRIIKNALFCFNFSIEHTSLFIFNCHLVCVIVNFIQNIARKSALSNCNIRCISEKNVMMRKNVIHWVVQSAIEKRTIRHDRLRFSDKCIHRQMYDSPSSMTVSSKIIETFEI